MNCPSCNNTIQPKAKYCIECGFQLYKADSHQPSSIEGERKHVTIMFSDLSGYTSMTERLDPEDVKNIMDLIFGKIIKIIKHYGGFIEKLMGDAVMAIFGIPTAHEDDQIRAIKAALEMHATVKKISPQYERIIGQPLLLHTGINSGLVITGKYDVEKGIHGLTGDAINLASRLEGIAQTDEIIIGPSTYNHAVNFFVFEKLESVKIKGKKSPIDVHKVISSKRESLKTHRKHGVQAKLTGRESEIKLLTEAVQKLENGQGMIVSISGEAGTGKSRLKKELKDSLRYKNIEWKEGYAYDYRQNTPYYPLINFLTHLFHIDESDSQEIIKKKIEIKINSLLNECSEYIPFIGSLFALEYAEIEAISPEYLKEKLHHSIHIILEAFSQKNHTIICFEDLHWADPSFIELLKLLLSKLSSNVLFILTYRPPFELSTDGIFKYSINRNILIDLKELSTSDVLVMLKSLLRSGSVPKELYEFVRKKTEGNPFFLEEVVNSLIENGMLSNENEEWVLNRKTDDINIPSTIQGVLSARIDRLERNQKKLLQEASVIGRTFYYQLLKRITVIDGSIQKYLSELETLDLVQTKSSHPDLEYTFKHALTQEVVYNSLLKSQRKEIHERIGFVIEQLYKDRLPELYETLSYHFRQSKLTGKALEYLSKSGEKQLRKFAVKEAHRNYLEAFKLLNKKEEKSEEEQEFLIQLLIDWSLVHYYRGDFNNLTNVLSEFQTLAESTGNNELLGKFYTWLGFSLYLRGQINKSYPYFKQALKIGEKYNYHKVVANASTWLVFNSGDLGLIEDSISYGKNAINMSEKYPHDHFLFYKPRAGLGQVYWYRGERQKCYDLGNELICYGNEHSNYRCLVTGHICIGLAFIVSGELNRAIDSFNQAIAVSVDPFYSQWPKIYLGFCLLENEEFADAERVLAEVVSYSEEYDCGYLGIPAKFALGITMKALGKMSEGLTLTTQSYNETKQINWHAMRTMQEHILGKLYLQIAEAREPIKLAVIIKNIGFIIKRVPFARKRAERHIRESIRLAEKLGFHNILGQAYINLGVLQKSRNRQAEAKESFIKAIDMFYHIGAKRYQLQAEHLLSELQPYS